MAEMISRTAHDDAPLSTARKPDVEALQADGFDARHGDALIGRTVTIDRPRQELYEYWRNFENLPHFMHNVRSVTTQGLRSHWVVEAPAGKTVEWDATIVEEEPGNFFTWQSADGAAVRNSGRVEFKDSPDQRGTCVTVTLTYDPPGGAIGQLVAKLFHKEPKIQARRDLRRFKQLMETGEVSTAQPPDAAPRA